MTGTGTHGEIKMGLLNKLPFRGKGSYEPNFKVKFESWDEGLDELVAAPLSGGTIRLAHADNMRSPIEEICVTIPNHSNGYSLEAGNGNFRVQALIRPTPGTALAVDLSHYSPEFKSELRKKGGDWKAVLVKPSSNALYNRVFVNLANSGWLSFGRMYQENELVLYADYVVVHPYAKSNVMYTSPADGSLNRQAARDMMAAFATALEKTLNSAYAFAGKHSPKMTLELKPQKI